MAAKYLTMVGQLQLLDTSGRFNIHAQVAAMSRFRAAPRQGHMDRLKRIYSNAIRTKDYAIRFMTDQPDYSFLPDQDFDWTFSVYGNVQEILPHDMPEQLVTSFYPSPKYFWSCTHGNSCQNYRLYINLHIVLNMLCKTTPNMEESRNFITSLKR